MKAEDHFELAVKTANEICGVDALSKTRHGKHPFARYLILYWMRTNTKMSAADIARKLGFSNHTLVLYGLRVIEKLVGTRQQPFAQLFDAFISALEAAIKDNVTEPEYLAKVIKGFGLQITNDLGAVATYESKTKNLIVQVNGIEVYNSEHDGYLENLITTITNLTKNHNGTKTDQN